MMFSVTTDWQDHIATVAISGELDLSSRDRAENAIGEAISSDGADGVVVDLTGLQFIDSSGIAVLLKGRRQADAAGVPYRVNNSTGTVRQVLSLTGVLGHLSGETG